ncbi:mothers against decapentaplegic homolog 6 [Sitodiplosis mosellana]|uniref:mothers against decapentaplegic homolog 6 n=1 Tax=Sitodiplosis mosellana TaxID=263140 RepID=UPI0024448B4E|nr:mothers against decapentaplegic homolog 6 [Sitodiplosis mosellana]
MSEKILINNESEPSLPLNNNYCQRNDNENSTIKNCYQCCSPMFFQRKRNLKRLWGLATTTASSLNQEQLDQHSMQSTTATTMTTTHHHHHHHHLHHYHQHPKCNPSSRSCNSTKFDYGGGCLCGNSNGDGNSSDCSIDSSAQYQLNPANMQTTNLYQLFCALTKKLKEAQVETLCQAVKYGQTTNCVLVPRLLIEGQDPHVIACRLWRWPDLRYAIELKRIPSCPNETDPVYVCCNPTHWFRICRTDSPPPPYSQFAMERLKPEDRTSEERVRDPSIFPGSLSTDGEEKSSSGWCQLAYWEQSQRVGRLFPVENSAVNIFAEQTRGDGLCLTTLAMQRLSATPDVVLKARQKIGLGVTLSREQDGVWIYNRSSAPVFVHSPTLSDIDSRSVLVYRVPPGHCLRAFDHDKAAKESYAWPTSIAGNELGPVDKYSVRISFAKGWGPNYTRLEVISCPCWLEVLLSTPYR